MSEPAMTEEELKKQYAELCLAYGDAQLKYKSLNKFIAEIEGRLADLEVKAKVLITETSV